MGDDEAAVVTADQITSPTDSKDILNRSLTQQQLTADAIEEKANAANLIESLSALRPLIRRLEVESMSSQSGPRPSRVLSKYWSWSWCDFIFATRERGTGDAQQQMLSAKKKEVYRCFHDFGMHFDAIIEFRGYALTTPQIELLLADTLSL